MEEQTPLDKTLDEFVKTNTKTKVAVIIPLYGYWQDDKDSELTGEVLKVVLNRVHSEVHQLYLIFVAEPSRVPKDVANLLIGKQVGGNTQGVKMDPGSSYPDYIRDGITTSLEATDAQFILILNPWVLLQHGGIDAMVERVNRGDDARIIAGYDFHNLIKAEDFDMHRIQVAKEERDLTFNFVGMARYTAEMFEMDEEYRTHRYIERDAWQSMYSRGYEVITSQHIPIFSFDLDWNRLEKPEDIAYDKQHFIKKWGFDPAL